MDDTGKFTAADRPPAKGWERYVFYRREAVSTTWTFRLALGIGLTLLISATSGLWIPIVGRGLVCEESVDSGDAILVDNSDQNYLVFERAAELRMRGLAPRVLVPTKASSPEMTEPDLVSAGIVDVMVRVARLPQPELIPIREIEPISLNAAYQMRDFLQKESVKSVIVVSSAFRSRRSSLIYGAVFGEVGIATSCVPVFGHHTTETWSGSWHGIQQVVEQFAKLQYYRFYVFPRVMHRVG
jgi:hypothetical protein